jgi:hypothetical protein
LVQKEKTLMKRPLKLLIAVAVLAALIGGYFLVSSLTKDETPVQNGGSQYDTPFLSVTGSLVRIDYTWKGEQIVLDATANGWAYAADPSFPLSNDALATIQTVVKDI